MSGKIIDAIISEMPIPCIKTNMCEVDYMPKGEYEISEHNSTWIENYQPKKSDIIVLLGRWVHTNFMFKNAKIIKLPHPASCIYHANKEDYVKNAIDKIKECIELK